VLYTTDICIVGAGPGGCATALFLAKAGIPSLLVDKARFPRDKICGDGLSGWSVAMLNRLDPHLKEQLAQSREALPSWGARFVAPNRQVLDVPFVDRHQPDARPPGYVASRLWFDNFLMEECRQHPLIEVVEGLALEQWEQLAPDQVLLQDATGAVQVRARLAVFANGAHSRQAKALAGLQPDKKHYVAGIRCYYQGVTGLHPDGHIELHFLKEFLPGYFWIFPLPGGKANVGVGMRSDVVAKKKVNLRKAMLQLIAEDPQLKERFQSASPLEDIKGFGLPLGSKKRSISGHGFMLVGDAASLIDPFTGEGIGNALASGELAALWAQKALEAGRYDAAFLKGYDAAIYKRLWKELRLSKTLQDLLNYPWLFSLVVNKATANETLRQTISCMLTDLDVRQQLKNPRFYFKVLFG
jgi:menaquinone-9 beta-reductase